MTSMNYSDLIATSKSKSGACDYLLKLLIIGDSGVGKSNLLLRFTDDVFQQSHLTTIGIDFKIKTVMHGNKKIKLQIWDTAGQERFRTIARTYYRGSHGVVIVYDVTDQESFTHVNTWLMDMERNMDTGICKILVGNKCDLTTEKIVPTSSGEHLAKTHGMKFFETSAKTNINIANTFDAMIKDVLLSINKGHLNMSKAKTILLKQPTQHKKCC